MGYWAKDGSYQYDESDIQLREAMNETQGQRYDRLNRSVSNKPLFTEKEQEQREAEYAKYVDQKAEVYSRIKSARIEEESRKEEERKREAQRESYETAKTRFKKLSPMKKLWLNLVGKGIGSYHSQNSVETLDSLYRGRSK